MLELIKIDNLSISQRIERAKAIQDENCYYTQNGNIYIREYKGDINSSVDAFCHSHEDFEVLIPLTPLPCLIQDDKVIFGEVGYCYPIPSHKKHGFNNKLTDISYIIVVMQKNWFAKIVSRMEKPVGAMKRFFRSNIIKDLIKMFQSVFKQEFELKENMLNSLGEALLIEMIRQNFVEYKTVIYKIKEYQRGIQYIVNFMNDNYSKDFTIDELSEMCSMSKYHFIRSFKGFTGLPPLEYLYKIRCSRAKYLFENTDKKVKEVAEMVGFKSPSSFVQVFKNYVGQTPSVFCEKARKREDI